MSGGLKQLQKAKKRLYCRCSTEKQRENMNRQKLRLMEFAHDKKYDSVVMEEIASGG
jgi:predicted site-specific integrase-resolvase